ncbi:SDR family NAD(P)-dependent oxidoreductase [Mangrovicoccus ximenensis]|uniref:SDR family NAD(P)-dependent oxidoreductase n=1 Tax=Mangrovicoccus ximenensis TaxID=1911570 RepID=UPI000D381F16|nr:glucose 1-dehydrogenase [Mangrovicoccus ximenensis]
MTGLLDGKVALITGAAGGIGRASAQLFAEEGARLVISDIGAEGVEETAALVRDAGGEVVPVVADLGSRDDIRAMVAAAVDTWGRLDCAFNNAGITGGQIGQGGRLTAEWDEDAFDRIIDINLKGTWLCMVAELNQMMAQEAGGAILSTASLAGIQGFPTTTGYSASKHAIVGMTKTAAMEYAPKVRVNALCPGYVDTPMLTDTMSRRGELILGQIPFGRLADPREMAQMAAWALSDRASYVSGQCLAVDGAFTAG